MTYTREQIDEKVMTNQKWLEKGIVAIYNYQTVVEQAIEDAVKKNDVGFNKADSPYLSYLATWILSGRHLSGYHVEKAKKRMKKYTGQLTRIANGEQ